MCNHPTRHRRGRILIAALLGITGAACAHAAAPAQSEPLADDGAVHLTVRNENWADMRVYQLRSNGSIGPRLATVTSLSSARVRIPEVQSTEGYVRLLLRPIGSTETYITEAVMVSPGTSVRLRVMNNLRLSYLHPLSN